MLLSRRKKFLFVHIQKTAGSSLREVLSANIPDLQSFLGTHDHAAWAQPHLGKEWPGYFKAAFVRNPWDRLVSWYAMIQQGKSSNRLWDYVRRRARTFEEFLLRCTDTIDDYDGRKSFLFNQLDYLTDERGQVIVDFIGRYENLADDADTLLQRLKIRATLPRVNPSQHDHYSSYYTDQTRELVADRYRRDIDYFGYTFTEATCSSSKSS